MFKSKSKEIARLKKECDIRDHVIEKLKEDIKDLTRNHTKLNEDLEEARRIIEEYRCLDAATPSDCKRGEWCKACEFKKEIHTRYGFFGTGTMTSYFCGKAESCQNFVQEKI